VETLSCIRTVLRLAEKVLDGCPIWGPKAAVAVTEEGLKAVQVRFYGSLFKTQLILLSRRPSRMSRLLRTSWLPCKRLWSCSLPWYPSYPLPSLQSSSLVYGPTSRVL
jgi:hypothetical protein